MEAKHWTQVKKEGWRWPSFTPAEMACRGTGMMKINPEAMDKLQLLRDVLGKPLIVNSAYRSPEHNARIGGAPKSKHMEGIAFDISMANHDPHIFQQRATEVGFQAIGTYPNSNFIHIDDRGSVARWGTQFPPSTTGGFASEQVAEPPLVKDGATLGGAAATAGTGILIVSELQDTLGGLHEALLPFEAYFPQLRLVFLGLVVAGVLLTLTARILRRRKGARYEVEG
ncbi:MAG: D-Ala-D-Ala carboxypeptidase family metallohydrolase [Pseudomonadota bacterium]